MHDNNLYHLNSNCNELQLIQHNKKKTIISSREYESKRYDEHKFLFLIKANQRSRLYIFISKYYKESM